MRLTRSALLALSLLAPVVATGAQAPPPRPAGTGLLAGQVVDAVTGKPVANAAVVPTLITKESPFGRTLSATASDNDGHFVLRDLPAGSLTIGVRKGGYVDGWYGAADSTGAARPVELGDAGKLGGLAIRVWPNATIGGTVLDDRGEPVIDVTVQALKRSLIAGRWRIGENYSFLHQARTDDRGEYRIADITPGDYAVVIVNTVASAPAEIIANVERLRDTPTSPLYQSAFARLSAAGAPFAAGTSRSVAVGDMVVTVDNPSLLRTAGGSMPFAFPTVFYPGVADASAAEMLSITAGQERLGVDFSMRAVRAVQVSGSIASPSGSVAGIPVRLVRAGDQLQGQFDSAATVTGPDGTFTFLGVTAGDYALRALDFPRPPTTTTQVGGTMVMETGTQAATEPTLWANTSVTVGDADVKDIALTLSTGARITGTVAPDANAPAPAAGRGGPQRAPAIDVEIETADARMLAARTQTRPVRAVNGTFASPQLPPGRYIVRSGVFSTVTLDGRDITETPIELGGKDIGGVAIVVRNTAATSLSGTVRPRVAGDIAKSTVLLFPANRAQWVDYGATGRRLQKAGVSRTGAYSFTGIPAGDYIAIAVDDDPKIEWRHPGYLSVLAGLGTAVSIRPNEPASLDLTAIKLPPAPTAAREPESDQIAEGRESWVPGPFVPESADAATDDAQQSPARDNAPATRGTGELTGTIVAAASSTPLRNAVVVLTCADVRYADSAITDTNGKFAFRNVPAARCTVAATKPGFLGRRYGAKDTSTAGTALVVSATSPTAPITIALPRAGVISGVIRDEQGQPVRGVTVMAMAYEMSGGERTLVMAQRSTNPTDNRGNYRLSGMLSGEYVIAVNRPTIGFYVTVKHTTPADYAAALKEIDGGAATASRPSASSQDDVGYTPTFYPGTPFVNEATTVTLALGEERSGIDVTLTAVRMATVKVHALGPDGQPPAGILGHLLRDESTPGLDFSASMMLPFPQPGATLTLTGVAPGRYTLDVGGTSVPPGPMPSGGFSWSPGATTGLPMYAQTTIDVSGKDVDVNVTLSNAISLAGKIVFESTGIASTTPPLAGTRAALMGPKRGGLELRTLFIPADATGVITYENLVPAPYRVQTTAPRGWMLKSATINGVDASDIPVDVTGAGEVVVTFSDRVTEISGTLQSASGSPAPGYTVIVFAADKKFWRTGARRIVTVRPANDGHFVSTGLPPGEYRIAAVTEVRQGEWFDPAFLEQLVPASVAFTIADGEKKVQNLQIK